MKVANRVGMLTSYDTAVVDMKFEEPLRPRILPTMTFLLKRPPNNRDPLLWGLLVDEISLQRQIGVSTRGGGAPGPNPLRRAPPPPCWVLARKCRTMGAEGALRKFCLT